MIIDVTFALNGSYFDLPIILNDRIFFKCNRELLQVSWRLDPIPSDDSPVGKVVGNPNSWRATYW